METQNDIFPTIKVGIEYGKYLDNFEIDVNLVAEYLRAGGLTDQQILDTTIDFSSKKQKVKNDRIEQGEYKKFTKKALIYHLDDIRSAHLIGDDDSAVIAVRAISNTTIHELEHRISRFDKTQKKINRKYFTKSTLKNYFLVSAGIQGTFVGGPKISEPFHDFTSANPILTGGVQLAAIGLLIFAQAKNKSLQKKIYDNNPEEIRAFAAEATTPNNLIILNIRNNPDSMSALSSLMAEMRTEHEAWKIKNAEETRLREEHWRLLNEEQAAWHEKMAQTYASYSANDDRPINT